MIITVTIKSIAGNNGLVDLKLQVGNNLECYYYSAILLVGVTHYARSYKGIMRKGCGMMGCGSSDVNILRFPGLICFGSFKG